MPKREEGLEGLRGGKPPRRCEGKAQLAPDQSSFVDQSRESEKYGLDPELARSKTELDCDPGSEADRFKVRNPGLEADGFKVCNSRSEADGFTYFKAFCFRARVVCFKLWVGSGGL